LISRPVTIRIVMMGNPENSPPARPRTVPEDARWDPKDPGFEWVLGRVDDEGRRHGPYRSWTRDGVLHGESNYVHGKVHGKNLNFHPDGTVASEADWVMGLILDSVFYRSDNPTTEPFAQANPNVWSVRYYTRDGKTNYTIRYFMRDGTECGPDGNALPPRPASVSPDARWFPDMDRWVDGAIERGTNNQVGSWRWWSREGVLRHEEVRDASGQATLISQYEPEGTLKKKTARGPHGEERDYYYEDGKLSTRYREDASGRQTYKASWQRDGELEEETSCTFDGDTLTSVTERGRGGVLRFEARREGPALACMLYQRDGKTMAATGLIDNDKLTGNWRIFDEHGAVRREVDVTPLELTQRPTAHGLDWELGHALYKTDAPAFATPEQLSGVDDEPWAETAGCFDEHVAELPQLLRGLTSPDPLIREYCLGAIVSEIEHQGSTYPATARVIPWLARLLSHPGVEQAKLLTTLQCAGQNTAPYVDQVQDMDAGDPERFAIEGTYKAIGAAWPLIFACFGAASIEERRMILVLAKYAAEAKADIIDVARHDSDAGMRACAIDSLCSMASVDIADVAPSLGDKDPLVRAATAIALALTKGPDAPREVVAALREAVHSADRDLPARWNELPYTDGHLLAYLSLATGSVRSADARSLAQALCERLDTVDAPSAVTYGQGLLALAFGRGERPFAKRFAEILAALAASKQFWVFNVNASEVLDKWHLPHSQGELAKLVAELATQSDAEAWLHAQMHAP
jgi:antitoxin component YwqK of YwqJK toxin-antitoxin module